MHPRFGSARAGRRGRSPPTPPAGSHTAGLFVFVRGVSMAQFALRFRRGLALGFRRTAAPRFGCRGPPRESRRACGGARHSGPCLIQPRAPLRNRHRAPDVAASSPYRQSGMAVGRGPAQGDRPRLLASTAISRCLALPTGSPPAATPPKSLGRRHDSRLHREPVDTSTGPPDDCRPAAGAPKCGDHRPSAAAGPPRCSVRGVYPLLPRPPFGASLSPFGASLSPFGASLPQRWPSSGAAEARPLERLANLGRDPPRVRQVGQGHDVQPGAPVGLSSREEGE